MMQNELIEIERLLCTYAPLTGIVDSIKHYLLQYGDQLQASVSPCAHYNLSLGNINEQVSLHLLLWNSNFKLESSKENICVLPTKLNTLVLYGELKNVLYEYIESGEVKGEVTAKQSIQQNERIQENYQATQTELISSGYFYNIKPGIAHALSSGGEDYTALLVRKEEIKNTADSVEGEMQMHQAMQLIPAENLNLLINEFIIKVIEPVFAI